MEDPEPWGHPGVSHPHLSTICCLKLGALCRRDCLSVLCLCSSEHHGVSAPTQYHNTNTSSTSGGPALGLQKYQIRASPEPLGDTRLLADTP